MEPFETLDKRFAPYTIPIVFLEKLHTGLRWAEGPVYFADQRCLLVQRPAQQSDPALRRADVSGHRLPRGFEFFQRQHARPAGPPGHLRASRPTGDPHGI